ncbi:DUF3016 domain-containing protein [Rhodanobacter sp. L36]|uniref:DUF3016 domain-containing protein n=1 Tax=Rhodanobacter sp. L36 TaxID=1747221 RepID=UPI00131BB3F0|nr:DUF3016 domain-containing protein [Rhodanobacter sp. L36]
MKSSSLVRLLCAACLAFASAVTYAATPPPDNVSVHYKDPKNFTEAKLSAGINQLNADDYLKPLKEYIAQRASRILTSGQHLDIEVTDVDRAGDFEPWHGPRMDQVRVIKSIYPPRIDLNFTLTDADGKVLSKGQRKLRDLAFMDDSSPALDSDSLRYEKGLIDRWLRKGVDKL